MTVKHSVSQLETCLIQVYYIENKKEIMIHYRVYPLIVQSKHNYISA